MTTTHPATSKVPAMTYAARRRQRTVIFSLIALLLLPPGAFTGTAEAASRTNTLGRESKLETFRNPQFSSSGHNRFLYTGNTKGLVGGPQFRSPATRGYGGGNSPSPLWLPNGGRLEWAETDLSMPSPGLSVSFTRMWRGSVTSYDGPLGKQWEFTWNKRLFEEGDNDVVFHELGRTETYDESSGSYTSPAGRYDTLAKDTVPDPDIFTRTTREGLVETYEDEGSGWYRLTEIEDLNGNTLDFAYDTGSKLTKVTDSLSRDTTLAYDASGRITKATDSASREWVYGYDGSGYLETVRTPTVDEAGTDHDYTSGKTTTYLYDTSGQLTAIKAPLESTASRQWAYDLSGNITKHTLNGADFDITYNTMSKEVQVEGREDEEVRYLYDSNDLITKRRVYYTTSDYHETSYSYNADAEVTLVTFPLGNRVEYFHDASGLITKLQHQKSSSDTVDPIEWTYVYASNARISTITDPMGRTWDYDYDASGNLITRTSPAVTVPSGIATSDLNGNSINDGTIREIWTYTSNGLPATYTDATGTRTDYAYTSVNSTDAYLDTVKADAGTGGLTLTTDYDHDAAGNVTKITDPESNVTTFTVNDLNQVIQTVEPLSVTRTTYYDEKDRVEKIEVTNDTDTGNALFVTEHEYDAIGNRTKTITDVTDTAKVTTTMAYDASDRLTLRTSPEGNKRETVFDMRGLRVTQIGRVGTSPDPNDAKRATVFDGNGKRITSTDPNGKHTLYHYDLLERLTKVEDPLGHYRTMAYDDNGNLTKSSSYNSADTKLAETTTSFDEANRAYKTERLAKKANLTTDLGDGLQTKSIALDERGRALEYSGDVCGCSAYEYVYDALGSQVTVKDPLPAATQNLTIREYDKNGNVTKITRKDKSQDTGIEGHKDIVTEMVYDARDRLVTRKETLATGVTADTIYAYGKRDQLTKTTSPEGEVTKTAHNERLWKTKDTAETSGTDVVTEYVYDDDGRMITYKAKNATTGDQVTEYEYDRLDRVVTITWPDSGEHIYTYDKASNRISATDPNGTHVVHGYDAANRLTAKDMTLGDRVGVDDIDYGYDGLGRMTSADAAEGAAFSSVIEWTYNTLGMVETEKQILDGYDSGAGRTITYDWNVSGQKTGVTYPVSGDVITYDRDDLDRVDVVSRGSDEVVDYAFNGRRVIEKAYPGSVAEHTYDLAGRLTKIRHEDTSSGNPLVVLDYGYDDDHQITHMDKLFYDDVENTRILDDTSDEGDQYAYDGAGRLVTVLRGVPTAKIATAMATNITNNDYDDLVEYVYDPTGNRLTRKIDGTADQTAAHNTVNELTTLDGETFSYDTNGNYLSTSAHSSTYQYDYENRLGQVTHGTAPNEDIYDWHYDALGRLVQRDFNGNPRSPRNYYDGQQIVEKVQVHTSTDAETAKRLWVHGPRIDEVLLFVDHTESPDAEYYHHVDHLGSVMALVDDGGAIAESYRYSEFGEGTVVDGTFSKTGSLSSPVSNPHRYTARTWASKAEGTDEEWLRTHGKHYRPRVGRFGPRVAGPLGNNGGSQGGVLGTSDPLRATGEPDDDGPAVEDPKPKPNPCVQQCEEAKADMHANPHHYFPDCSTVNTWFWDGWQTLSGAAPGTEFDFNGDGETDGTFGCPGIDPCPTLDDALLGGFYTNVTPSFFDDSCCADAYIGVFTAIAAAHTSGSNAVVPSNFQYTNAGCNQDKLTIDFIDCDAQCDSDGGDDKPGG